MAAYVITDVEITDEERYREFLGKVTGTVEAYGGRFVARGGTIDVVKGSWTPERIAILESGSVEDVTKWLSSPEYSSLDAIRTSSSNINMVVVQGL